jgi:hypothetical protein
MEHLVSSFHAQPIPIGGSSKTTGFTEESLDRIPEELRRRPQWVVWKYELVDGKLTKVPYIAGGVGRASTTDLNDLETLRGGPTRACGRRRPWCVIR